MSKAGFTFLVSPDSALIKEELEKRIAAWNISPDPKRLVFWGDEEPDDVFWESLKQVGLFSEKRVIVVRQAESWSASAWKLVSNALARELEHVWPFFCLEVEAEKGKLKIPGYIQKLRCFEFADKKGWVWRNPGLGTNIQSFIRDHAKKLGLNLRSQELNAFSQICPRDAQGIINELQKLSLLSEDGNIKPEWIDGGESALEQDAFALIRQLTSGELASAWNAIGADSDGSLLFFVIALLSREFRLLWQITRGESPRLYPADAARKKDLARRLGTGRLADGFAALADAEWQVKSGRQNPQQALEILAVKMAEIFNRT